MDTPTIFVVDDTPTSLNFVTSVLGAVGFRTLSAGDGASARAAIRAEQPDLILLDVLMPGESGFETCAQLKSNPLTAEIPIIFLSSLDDVKNKVAGLKIGGVDYIVKPFHAEEVLARVRVHLRIRETNRALAARQRETLDQLRQAQQSILASPQDYPDAHFAVYYKALEEAGGDFYDVVSLGPGIFAYFVADISGHGTEAAFLMSAVKALLRQYAGPLYSPEDAMRGVNSVMGRMLREEQYLTACYARLHRHSRLLTVIGAGHPPMILVGSGGASRIIELDSDPLGIFGAAVLQRREIRLAKGDRLFMYTDGLIEDSKEPGRRDGLERLVKACVRHRAVPLDEVAQTVAHELRPGRAEDDLLLLAVDVV